MTKKDTQSRELLDQFSTSPTTEDLYSSFPSEMLAARCEYNAPFFYYGLVGKSFGISQGNCNHWDCKRCGILRAKHEYWRMINGLEAIGKDNPIFFVTITCRGSEITARDAEKNYLKWTNRFLDACRAKCKRSSNFWCYVQVTERQKRAHPHSHILTTFDPSDTKLRKVKKYTTDRDGKRHYGFVECLGSEWVANQVVRSGLGEQYDISTVETLAAASRYVAKYLFKETALNTKWPKGWKRVRYSQSFPKAERLDTSARVLLSRDDWIGLSKLAVTVKCSDYHTWQVATKNLRGSDVLIR